MAIAALLLAIPGAALADDVHWLGEDRYLIRYKERDIDNAAEVLRTARAKGEAMCELLGRVAFSVDEQAIRERLRSEFESREMAVDVVLYEEYPVSEESPAQPEQAEVVRACPGGADERALRDLSKALRRADLLG